MADLNERQEDFTIRNARLLLIGNGDPLHIRPFREDTGYSGEIYTDPNLKIYSLLDFKRNIGAMFGMKSFVQGLRSIGTRHAMIGIQGDALQQGGAVIAGPEDVMHYFYKSSEVGDWPPVKDMLAVCEI